ncbi:18573_t:CDS:2 [Funneliformis geosporum]|nr:18573_t:CDS:2 [Funneliformis geosporum]
MATLPDALNSMISLLAQIPQYVSQELPDNYYNKVMQTINYGHSLGVATFNNGVKTNILAGKMAGRFTSSNPFNNSVRIAVVTPALFIAWLRETYHAVKLGSAQASMKALITNKFLSINTPEIYEKRIKPFRSWWTCWYFLLQ